MSERRSWMAFDGPGFRLLDMVVIAGGLAAVTTVCIATIESPFSRAVWILLSSFYFLFYRRLASVIYWSWSTIRLVRKNTIGGPSQSDVDVADADLPVFHILIAAYGAGASIGPVMAAIDQLDYPKSRYTAWIITEQSEVKRRDQIVATAQRKILGLLSPAEIPAEIFPTVWKCVAPAGTSTGNWIKQVAGGNLAALLSHPSAPTLLMQDLLERLFVLESGELVAGFEQLAPLRLSRRDKERLMAEVSRLRDTHQRVVRDFARLLGSGNVFQSNELREQLIAKATRARWARRLGRLLCSRLASTTPAMPVLDATALACALHGGFPTTQEEVARSIEAAPVTSFRHLDPTDRGFKPGALNIAWCTLKNEGLLDLPSDVFFLVIDADSLLPRHALRAAAKEIIAGPKHVLRQICSVPTANFPVCGAYSQFVAFADAVGAIGKWARSTRRQLKPDLHAGSGVIIPATLAGWIANHAGSPWDASSLTEDARMIVGQFGMMNAVRSRTGFVPAYLLEAVPAEDTFMETYRAYWKQRRRWTTGGFDESFYMALSPGWVTASWYDGEIGSWTLRTANRSEHLLMSLRRLNRLGLWLWDHFLWGLGGFFVLTHWWIVSSSIATPSAALTIAGLVLLAVSPLLVLAISVRELVWFVPGGISRRKKILLYGLSFVAIWAYVLPVVFTQVACCLGLRSKILEWNPTRKPKY